MIRRFAFTLIELLVVIAVVAILAALLFPVFTRSRRNALRTQCISNLRQIGIATQHYVEDWSDRLPYAFFSGNIVIGGQHKPYINEVMNAYVSDQRIWCCPADTGEIFFGSPLGFRQRTRPFYHTTMFGVSYNYPGVGWSVYHYPKAELGNKPISYVKMPALAPLMFEYRPWHGNYSSKETFSSSKALTSVLYCDGHVAMRPFVGGIQWDYLKAFP